jgi:16S rRNA U516 pseudouridylate synthase RsuA-like enzyme
MLITLQNLIYSLTLFYRTYWTTTTFDQVNTRMICTFKIQPIRAYRLSRFAASSALQSIQDVSSSPSNASQNQPPKRKINQIIGSTGLFSRREAEQLIFQRRVTVAGQIITSPFATIDIDSANTIEIDGVLLRAKYNTQWPRLWVVQKWKDEIMSMSDNQKSRPLFFDRVATTLLPQITNQYGPLIPCYRLDYATEGLVFLTNSGALAKLLISTPPERTTTTTTNNHHNPMSSTPRTNNNNNTNSSTIHYGVTSNNLSSSSSSKSKPKSSLTSSSSSTSYREYKVRVHGNVTPYKLQTLLHGVYIDGHKYRFRSAKLLQTTSTPSNNNNNNNNNKKKSNAWLLIQVDIQQENQRGPHMIQRVLQGLFLTVNRLICIGFGPFHLSNLLINYEKQINNNNNMNNNSANSNSNNNHQMMNWSMEVKLPAIWHAHCLRYMNHRHAIQLQHRSFDHLPLLDNNNHNNHHNHNNSKKMTTTDIDIENSSNK